MNLQSNDFELFGLSERFKLSIDEIDAARRDLQRQAHPDRFAVEGAAAQRLAAQWSARINQAHARLKAPIARAAYLCELRGAAIAAENNTAMSPTFLMEQMAWREALSEAKNERDLDEIGTWSRDSLTSLLSKIELQLDDSAAPNAASDAATLVRQALFIEKFRADLDLAYERLSH